jgi:hypothetical protein
MIRRSTTPLLALVFVAACGSRDNQPKFANDGDTGAPAPATVITPSPTTPVPDDTALAGKGGAGESAMRRDTSKPATPGTTPGTAPA